MAVTPSDEAFAWQVLANYSPLWEEDHARIATGIATTEDSSDDGCIGKVRGKVGPKKGFKNTAGKTVEKYNEYICLVGRSRKGRNAKKWSDLLKLAAQQEKLNQDKEKKKEQKQNVVEETPVVETPEYEQDFREFTKIDLEEAMREAEAI